MNLLYEAHDLCRLYGGITALSLPFFRMEWGETVVLTGRNGSGKSTLLRMLAFLEKPDSGTLTYMGDNISPRREITLLLQEPYLMRASVFWNVTLGLRLRGADEKTLIKRYEECMLAVGFADPGRFSARRSGELSGGEKQRIALASRLVLSPKVLLLDEPTSNVDEASEKAILDVVRSLREKGVSVVCATHDRAMAEALGAREVRLSHRPSMQGL